MKTHKSKKGFTLIELLVVITIIGILASIVALSMGGAIDMAKIEAEKGNLDAFKKATFGVMFPKKADLDGSKTAGFAAWIENKTKLDDPTFWYTDAADDVAELQEDGEDGIPIVLGDGNGKVHQDVTTEQQEAMSWAIAIPNENARKRKPNDAETVHKYKFPLIWTKGLQTDGEWDQDSPYGGGGGLILWSDGSMNWYEDANGPDDKGIFMNKTRQKTKNIKQGLPEGWDIITPTGAAI